MNEYTRKNWEPNNLITADDLNRMEEGIAEANRVAWANIPYIGANGNWWIGENDTHASSNGNPPYIGANGNWWSGETDTGFQAIGKDYILTDNDKNEITARVYELIKNGGVIGFVDENNNIIISGTLADGTYTVKYEMADGSTVDIGELKFVYAVINNLTNCVNSNSETSVVNGGSYSATISANSGYELKSVSVTMGGSPVSVTDGVINIASVTGDIVITAVAEKAKEITNFIEYNADNTSDWNIWCNNARIGSDGLYRSSTASNVTNYIPVQNGDIVYWRDMPIYSVIIGLYKSDKTNLSSAVIGTQATNGYIKDNTSVSANTYEGQLTINNASVAYIRFTIKREGYTSIFDNDDGIVNIERNGELL